MVPWVVSLAVFGAGAIALDGVERAVALGAFSASCLGALLAVAARFEEAADLTRARLSKEEP